MKNEKGFTLIELLVVIGIIGILSGIVLVNVNSARNKAKDSAIKGSLEQARLAAELFYDGGMVYTGFCAAGDATRISASINANGGAAVCNDAASAYCASSTLPGGGSLCVDATGQSKAAVVCGVATACP